MYAQYDHYLTLLLGPDVIMLAGIAHMYVTMTTTLNWTIAGMHSWHKKEAACKLGDEHLD